MIFLKSQDEIKSKFVRNLDNACVGKIAANEQINCERGNGWYSGKQLTLARFP